MTAADAPVNVNGIETTTVPDVVAAVDVNAVGNGSPNLFDALVQRVNDWTLPSTVDDSDLGESDPANASSGILLLSTDLHGTPSVVGTVRVILDCLVAFSNIF